MYIALIRREGEVTEHMDMDMGLCGMERRRSCGYLGCLLHFLTFWLCGHSEAFEVCCCDKLTGYLPGYWVNMVYCHYCILLFIWFI